MKRILIVLLCLCLVATPVSAEMVVSDSQQLENESREHSRVVMSDDYETTRDVSVSNVTVVVTDPAQEFDVSENVTLIYQDHEAVVDVGTNVTWEERPESLAVGGIAPTEFNVTWTDVEKSDGSIGDVTEHRMTYIENETTLSIHPQSQVTDPESWSFSLVGDISENWTGVMFLSVLVFSLIFGRIFLRDEDDTEYR